MKYKRKLYIELANLVQTRRALLSNRDYAGKYAKAANQLVAKFLAQDSGFYDTKIDLGLSHGDRLVFYTSFLHIDDKKRTEHTVTVTPSLQYGFHMRIGGRNYRDVKSYIVRVFEESLNATIDWDDGMLI